MKKLFKSLLNVLATIGGVVITVAWASTFINITIGLAAWSWQWCDKWLSSLISSFSSFS